MSLALALERKWRWSGTQNGALRFRIGGADKTAVADSGRHFTAACACADTLIATTDQDQPTQHTEQTRLSISSRAANRQPPNTTYPDEPHPLCWTNVQQTTIDTSPSYTDTDAIRCIQRMRIGRSQKTSRDVKISKKKVCNLVV